MQTIDNLKLNMDALLKSIAKVHITDVIDIILVAYVIYFFMKWIKETRAWSLFKGIIILAMLQLVFLTFKLYTMSWLLKTLFDAGLIALIVLFQPEIRKALEQLGKGKFFVGSNNMVLEVNKEIVKALRLMSNERTGALICIEKGIALGDYEKTGIPIDGIITSQILVNIFVDKTPLHDGAVIIRNNRIAAAGCILPVTSQEIGKELGTRHRAAVGLSEVTDCLVLIVSEETGATSVARGGKLLKKLSMDDVYDILQRDTDEEKPKRFSVFGRWK